MKDPSPNDKDFDEVHEKLKALFIPVLVGILLHNEYGFAIAMSVVLALVSLAFIEINTRRR